MPRSKHRRRSGKHFNQRRPMQYRPVKSLDDKEEPMISNTRMIVIIAVIGVITFALVQLIKVVL